MSYRDKTPTVISILQRRLKPGKTFEDFQKAHVPGENANKNEFGYEIDFFGVPTRVINAISVEDTNVIYSIGLSYGDVAEIFKEAIAKSKEDSQPGKRGDKLDEICDDMAPPVIAFVGSDNDYGGKGLEYKQTPLAKVTPEITKAVKEMMSQKPAPLQKEKNGEL